MRDVERIGNHSEEFADSDGFLAGERTAGTGGYNGGIYEKNYECAVQAVEPFVSVAANMRHNQRNSYSQRAPGYSAAFKIDAQFAQSI